MAGTLVKVRFKRPWQTYRVGEEITPNGTLRDFLVGRGYAEIVRERPALESPVNRAAVPNHVRGPRTGRR